MKYSRTGPLKWDALAAEAAIRLRPYRRFDLERSALLLAADSPGWAAVAHDEIDSLFELDGSVVGDISGPLRNTLGRLYRAGLIAVDGQTGLSGAAECGCGSGVHKTVAGGVPREAGLPSPPPPSVLLIKLTGACNWACTYCYDYDKARFRDSLQLEDVAGAIEHMAACHRRIAVIFHGGEPLLLFSEMKRIVAFAESAGREHDCSVGYSVQTNGVLLDDEIIGFLDAHAFDIGMSLDGPPDLNDLTRVDHQGRGTGRAVEALYARNGDFMSRRVGVITTVTAGNVDHLDRIAGYLRDLGVRSWKTAIFDVEGRGGEHPELKPPIDPYIAFMRQWLDECEAGRWNSFKFKNVLELIDAIASPKRPSVCLKLPCGAGRDFMVASADRNLMACDATYDSLFVLGRTRDGLNEALTSENARLLDEREHWLLTEAPCAACPWLHYCAGTCMAKALITRGTIKAVDDFECAVRMEVFPILFEKLIKPQSGLRNYYLASHRASPAAVF
jgi:uncharacterized protein